ncbi:MAG: alpha-L-fucosidase [Planctomycetota bacterium]
MPKKVTWAAPPMLLSALVGLVAAQASSPAPADLEPLPPLPTARQLDWHDRRFYAFVHFGPNTFTGVEWGEGRESPDVFQPAEFDPGQWVDAFAAAGMSGVILTAKHHDGFCLWPSDVTEHDVASSSWQGGGGDVLGALAEACAERGIWLGVYLSPWDRHEPTYGTGTAYDDHFVAQLTEVLTRYGPIAEVWFDGANGEGPSGRRQVYDWPRYVATVREHQPDAVIFSDAGPDVRWCGNERAVGSTTNWALLRRDDIEVGTSKTRELGTGHRDGTHWVPAECNTSIRPGWFWRAGLDGDVSSLDALVETWLASVGRGGNFLLNVPPDDRGRIPDVDVRRLALFGSVLERTYQACRLREAVDRGGVTIDASNVRREESRYAPRGLLDPSREVFWAVSDGHDADGEALAWVEIRFPEPVRFDEVWLEEPIQMGQRIDRFRVRVESEGEWLDLASGTTIGPTRILRVPETSTSALRVSIDAARATPALSRLALFLTPPRVSIEPQGSVAMSPVPVTLRSREGTRILYTLDGSEPAADSPEYDGPLRIAETATLRARAFEGAAASPLVSSASFRVLGADDMKTALQFVQPPTPGLRAEVYEGAWQTLDQMNGREPVQTVDVEGFDLGVRTRSEQCALAFVGYVQVPEDGLYTFALVSDDGSRLSVHDERVVDNDGLHGMERADGKVALRAGYHPIRIEWFNARGGAGLEVRWSGPGVGRDVPVPPDALFR